MQRWFPRLLKAGLFAGLLGLLGLLGLIASTFGPTLVIAQSPQPLKIPAPAGTLWEVVAGYNTVTHNAHDPYAIDIIRTDAGTAGTPLLAPLSGTVNYLSTDCLTIRDPQDHSILLCHVFTDPSLQRGDPVVQGQRIGTVAPAGFAGNNGLAHIHIAVHTAFQGLGATLPFTGLYALDGLQLAPITGANGYLGLTFLSTNLPAAPLPPPNTDDAHADDDNNVDDDHAGNADDDATTDATDAALDHHDEDPASDNDPDGDATDDTDDAAQTDHPAATPDHETPDPEPPDLGTPIDVSAAGTFFFWSLPRAAASVWLEGLRIVWHYNQRADAWEAYVPELGSGNFVVETGDTLWLVAHADTTIYVNNER